MKTEEQIKSDFYMKIVNYNFNGENPYISPLSCGLNLIETLDRSDGSYQFDYCCVWERDKAFYYAFDSGCSCPTPFENITCLADLTYLGNIDYFEKELNNWYDGSYGSYCPSSSKSDISKLISKLKTMQKEWS